MNGSIASGLHAAAWLLVYTSAVAASILVVLFARADRDRPLRRLAAREAYAVVVISLAYVSEAFGLNAAMSERAAAVFSAIINGALLHALALIATALYPFAAGLVDADPGVAYQVDGAKKRRRAAWNAAAAGLGLLFGFTSFFGAARGPNEFYRAAPFLRAVAIAPLAIVAVGLSAAVAASAWRLLSRSGSAPERGARRARDAMAIAAACAYAAFIALELSPQFMPSIPHDSPPSYYALAAFFAVLNVGILASVLSRAARAHARFTVGLDGGDGTDGARREDAMKSAGLSAREREVAALLAEGASYKDIADRLYVSVSTVQTHVTRIYAKLGVSNKVELSNALRRGPGVV